MAQAIGAGDGDFETALLLAEFLEPLLVGVRQARPVDNGLERFDPRQELFAPRPELNRSQIVCGQTAIFGVREAQGVPCGGGEDCFGTAALGVIFVEQMRDNGDLRDDRLGRRGGRAGDAVPEFQLGGFGLLVVRLGLGNAGGFVGARLRFAPRVPSADNFLRAGLGPGCALIPVDTAKRLTHDAEALDVEGVVALADRGSAGPTCHVALGYYRK